MRYCCSQRLITVNHTCKLFYRSYYVVRSLFVLLCIEICIILIVHLVWLVGVVVVVVVVADCKRNERDCIFSVDSISLKLSHTSRDATHFFLFSNRIVPSSSSFAAENTSLSCPITTFTGSYAFLMVRIQQKKQGAKNQISKFLPMLIHRSTCGTAPNSNINKSNLHLLRFECAKFSMHTRTDRLIEHWH